MFLGISGRASSSNKTANFFVFSFSFDKSAIINYSKLRLHVSHNIFGIEHPASVRCTKRFVILHLALLHQPLQPFLAADKPLGHRPRKG